MKIYILISGEYQEGGRILSVHLTKAGAELAKASYLMENHLSECDWLDIEEHQAY